MYMYSWGEFYDTLQELEGPSENEDVEKGLALIKALQQVKFKKEIREALDKFPLTEIQRLRMNSLCLDGIIASYKKKNPIVNVVKKNLGMDTYLYYLERKIGSPCLALACKYGRKDLVEHMVKTLPAKFARDGQALLWASEGGFVEIVKLLLNTYTWDKSCYYERAFEAVCKSGSEELFHLLLPKWQFHSAFYDKCNALKNAIDNNNIHIVKLLLNINESYMYIEFALQYSVEKEQIEIVKFLISNYNLNAYNFTPIFIHKNKQYIYPFWNIDFLNLIMKKHKDSFREYMDSVHGKHVTNQLIQDSNDEILQFLWENDINISRGFVKTLERAKFFYERKIPFYDIMLLEKFSNKFDELNNVGISDSRILFWACREENIDLIKKLLERNAKIDPGYEGSFALWKFNPKPKVLELLMKSNAIFPMPKDIDKFENGIPYNYFEANV